MKTSEANSQILRWRNEAREANGLTIKELARKTGCSASTLTHKDQLHMLPFYQAMTLKELAEAGKERGRI